MNLIQTLEKEQADKLAASKAIPDFAPGDTVIVNVKVVEGERSRVQAYEGVCIAPLRRRPQRELHRPQDFLRRGRRARLPALFADDRLDQGGAPRQGAPRQALLPARPPRQVGPHRRAQDRAARPRRKQARQRAQGRRGGGVIGRLASARLRFANPAWSAPRRFQGDGWADSKDASWRRRHRCVKPRATWLAANCGRRSVRRPAQH